MRYFGKYPNDTSLAEMKELFLPYRYGHATQVQVLLHPVCKHDIVTLSAHAIAKMNAAAHQPIQAEHYVPSLPMHAHLLPMHAA